ncbi:MAG: hemolysin III family protein [Bdellovibrionota bacterium]
MSTTPLLKPLLRGHFHQAAFFSALGACGILIANSVSLGATGLFSIIVYSIALNTLFAVSALYHRPQWSEKARAIMRKLDHVAIFLIIAGTSVPLCLLGIRGELGQKLLIIVVTACSLGALKEFLWIKSPKWITAILYVGVSWVIIPYSSELLSSLGLLNFCYLIIGGLLYTIGAVFYALKRPNFFPKVFGYHELFHLMVIFGAISHFILVYRLVNK